MGRPGSPRNSRSLEKSGALKVPDPERAAWQFVDLCQSYVYKRLLFGVVDSISREEIEASVEAGVDVFMKAYGARAPLDTMRKLNRWTCIGRRIGAASNAPRSGVTGAARTACALTSSWSRPRADGSCPRA